MDHVQKLDMPWGKVMFLPKLGLKLIVQVHFLYTKWRLVVPHLFKDKLCHLPPNDVIRMVIKRVKPRKQKKHQATNDQTKLRTFRNNRKNIRTYS